MEKNKIERYRIRLLNERDRILRTIEQIHKTNTGINQRSTLDELSLVDNHPADMAAEMLDKERDFALLGNEQHLLEDVEKALRRIDLGKYGVCVYCSKEIEQQRLDFLPSASTCVECERKTTDRNTYIYDRPVEEERMKAFGRYFMDNVGGKKDATGYDSEDAWKEVERINKTRGLRSTRELTNDSYRSDNHELYNETDVDVDDDYGNSDLDNEDFSGYVEKVESISNQYYKNQLP